MKVNNIGMEQSKIIDTTQTYHPLATYIKEGREEVAGPRGRARCGESY